MPVPTLISQLSTTASLNSPDGAVDVPSSIDDYQRAHAAFIAQLRDRTATDWPNTPAGNIAATTVQAALNELDSEKAKVGALASSGITGAAASGANADITSMTAVTSISATGGTAVKGTNTNDSAAAGYVGEYIESFAGPVSAPATNTYGDITSITLTAGDWDISAIAASIINTGVSITSVISGIGTEPGASGVGLVNGDNQGSSVPPTAQYLPTITIPPKRVLIASTTTYYLKMWISYASGTPQFHGRISARRVR